MIAIAFNKNNLSVNQKYKEHLEKEDSVNILSKKDSKKVIYGADNTGDILFSDNQKWFIQTLHCPRKFSMRCKMNNIKTFEIIVLNLSFVCVSF